MIRSRGLRAILFGSLLLSGVLPCVAKPDSSENTQGKIEFKEYKKHSRINLKVSQSRVFKLRNRIVRTSIADPGISAPVVVAPYEFVLLGNYPGTTTMFLWDETGAVAGFDIVVSESHSFKGEISSLANFYRRIFSRNKLIATRPYSTNDLVLEEEKLKNPGDYYHKLADINCVVWRHSGSPPGSYKPKTKSSVSKPKTRISFDNSNMKAPEDCVEKIPYTDHKVKYQFKQVKSRGQKDVNLQIYQSRLFRANNRLVKTVVSNARIAEPVIVSENEVVLFGKRLGTSKIEFEDDQGNSSTIAFHLRKRKLFSFFFRDRKESVFPPVDSPRIELAEAKIQKSITLKTTEPKLFKSNRRIVRVAASDPELIKPVMVSPNYLLIDGLGEGSASVFVWDESGAAGGMEVNLTCNHKKKFVIKDKITPEAFFKSGSKNSLPVHDIEMWTGDRFVYCSFPITEEMEKGELPELNSLKSVNLGSGDRFKCIGLNNTGVHALNKQDYKLAIRHFEAALKADPKYELAKVNLAIAYNNYALSIQKTPMESMKMFHQALFLDPTNKTTISNVDGIFRYMGRDPNSFRDRVDVGNKSLALGDIKGAIVEYQAALKIKDDPAVRSRLKKLLSETKLLF